MKISPFRDVKKTWGVVRGGVGRGNYMLTIRNNWDGRGIRAEKHVIFTTNNRLGCDNFLLSYLLLIFGGISLLLALGFGVRKC